MRKSILFVSLVLIRQAWAQTGIPAPELADLDRAALKFLAQSQVPGAALAVVKDNRLVYARGFGSADLELKTPMMPDTLMRIGSISKPITAIAILKLVERGRLELDAPIVPLLGRRIVDPSKLTDPRWNRITVRHLLNHSGGWDADSTFDPLFPPPEVLSQLGIGLPLRRPLTIDFLISAMAALPLQFEPGNKFSYSNFGFAILTRIVEISSGVSYERFVQREILEPIGIQRMQLASGKRSGRHLGEASYYDSPDNPLLPAVYPDTPDPVAAPDGGFYMEIIQGAGAWVGSAVDLVRLAVAVDGGLPAQLLRPSTRALWTAPPPFALNESSYYGLGVVVEKNAGALEWWHDGAINGSQSYLQGSTAAGVRLALIVNGWPPQKQANALEAALAEFESVLRRVSRWPQSNQFESFHSLGAPLLATNGVAITASSAPGKALAGSFATLFGNNLAGEGLTVTFDGLPAPVVFASRNQVNVIVPSALAGRADVRAEIRRKDAAPVSVSVSLPAVAPALFTISGNGQGPAAALNEDGSLNSEQNPAKAGSNITVFANGLGQFTKSWQNSPAPAGAELAAKPKIFVDDRPANFIRGEAVPGAFGQITRVVFAVPAGVAQGLVRVRLESSGANSRSAVYIWTR
ncbi:MAG: serine hydrolase [Bryobacteraceae bacterium]